MKRPLLFLAAVMVAGVALAQPAADVAVTIVDFTPIIAVGDRAAVEFLVRNDGPDTARNVRVAITPDPRWIWPSLLITPFCTSLDCPIGDLAAGQQTPVRLYVTAPATAGDLTAGLRATSSKLAGTVITTSCSARASVTSPFAISKSHAARMCSR